MMEQTNAGKAHYHTILVAGIDNIVITNRSTWLSDILNARLMGTLDVVTEGEECIGAKAYIGILIQPCSLLFTGEIGRIDDTRFIETTLMCNGACAASDPAYSKDLVHGAEGAPATLDVYQAVIFGDAYIGFASSLPVELRDNGVEDFGRKRSLAWYAIFGVGRLHNEYGVVIETV